MNISIIISIISISIALVSSAKLSSYNAKCFESYLQEVIRINRNYEYSLQSCYDEDDNNRQPPQQFKPKAALEKYKQTSSEACSNITICSPNTDLIEFFKCYSKHAEQNMHTYFVMHLNASSMAMELNDRYDQEEKEVIRCQLAAKREYISEFFAVYKKNVNCLSNI